MKVCFVAPYSYSLFDPSQHYPFGGIEVQAHLLATGLARRNGYDVSFVVFDHDQPSPRNFSGVRVLKYLPSKRSRIFPHPVDFLVPSMLRRSVSTSAGRVVALGQKPLTKPLYHAIMAIQGFIDCVRALRTSGEILRDWLTYHRVWLEGRSAYYRFPNRVETYRLIDADVYIGFGASELMAELAASCRLRGRKFVLFGASDSDFDDSYVPRSMARNYYGCRAGHCHFSLISADHVVVQNDRQKEAAWKHFGQDGTIILNPIDLSVQPNPERPMGERDTILWIGKADMVKRPLLVYDIARACPDLKFKMVINPNRPEVQARLVEERPDNVEIVEMIARSEVPAAMERSILLVNTSRFEGFSNAFLEAFRAGTPVVSLAVDPSRVIDTWGCGRALGGDMDAMIAAIRHLASDKTAWETASASARDYVARHHAIDVIIDQVVEVLGR